MHESEVYEERLTNNKLSKLVRIKLALLVKERFNNLN